jgi:hypothetical protein
MSCLSLPRSCARSPYFQETRRPWPNLLFIVPLLLLYEIGMTCVQLPGIRNGADAWLRSTLLIWGAPGGWLLPAAVIVVLLAWHLAAQQPWRVHWETFLGMAAESLLYACGLILVGQAVEALARHSGLTPIALEFQLPGVWSGNPEAAVRVLSFLGAGIYEEFLFRLCLIPLAHGLFCSLLIPPRWALLAAMISTSVIFALAHYLMPAADVTALTVLSDAVAHVQSRRELWFGFGFRVLAGITFAGLFCFRGFGIAVGAHALYDVVVGCVLTCEL